MNQELLIKQIIQEVLKGMNQNIDETAPNDCEKSSDCIQNVSYENYPLGEKIPDMIKTDSGKKLPDVTLDKIISGDITASDMRISKETLELQAQVAESVGRHALAQNLRKAAELIAVPDDRILEIYNSLRPYRSTKQELYDIASELESKYSCNINAAFVREAADVYEKRGRLKGN